MLPSRALSLINEYSKPMTKPNWRNSKPIVTTYQMYDEIINVGIPSSPLKFILLMHIIDTDWYYLFTNIKYNGKLDIIDIIHIDGFEEVELYYEDL
jgi:hypothetical protein